jgi:hypothetical protein
MNQNLVYFASVVVGAVLSYLINQLPGVPDGVKPWLWIPVIGLTLLGAWFGMRSQTGAVSKYPEYATLERHLRNSQWKEADDETRSLLYLKSGLDRSQASSFGSDEVSRLSRETLKTIDDLWRRYSDGRFGFSVQKDILIRCGGNPYRYTDGDWEKFISRIGWDKSNSDSRQLTDLEDMFGGTIGGDTTTKYNFSISAPPGHLPSNQFSGWSVRTMMSIYKRFEELGLGGVHCA